ncbi:hypothetical protein HD806DRAFT_551178 [Xylariaceae sp. AK1471]|nr:hypothetical protein HD806DRAFT_551178 [Xylariaceae sp. AK1471]
MYAVLSHNADYPRLAQDEVDIHIFLSPSLSTRRLCRREPDSVVGPAYDNDTILSIDILRISVRVEVCQGYLVLQSPVLQMIFLGSLKLAVVATSLTTTSPWPSPYAYTALAGCVFHFDAAHTDICAVQSTNALPSVTAYTSELLPLGDELPRR